MFSFLPGLGTKPATDLTSGPDSEAFSRLLREAAQSAPLAVNCFARHTPGVALQSFKMVERLSPQDKAGPAFKRLNLPEHGRIWWYNLNVSVCVLFRRWRQVFSVPLTPGLWRDSWLLLFKDQSCTWLSSCSHVTELISCEQRLSTCSGA